MRFTSTRGGEKAIISSEAIINGISRDGGLYVPLSFPNLFDKVKDKSNMTYEEFPLK